MPFIKQLFVHEKPLWEKLFSQSELDTFYGSVSQHFQKQNRSFKIKNGYVIFQGGKERIDLRNMAQSCRRVDKELWEEIIESNLRQLESVKANALSLGNKPYSEVVDLLAVRIYPEGTLNNVGAKNLIYRKDLEGTISTVVLDLPESFQAVTPRMADGWGKSETELFGISLENTLTRHTPDVNEIDLGDGTIKAVTLTKNDDFLISTHILALNRYQVCVGKYGGLVGIPLNDLVVIYPVNFGQIKREIGILSLTIRNVYVKGPGSVSPLLYWYNENRFETIYYIEKENRFVLPDRLLELME